MGAGEAEALLAHHLFDDGVAALIDLQGIGIVELGLAVVPLAGECGPADEDIDFGEGGGGLFEASACEDRGDEAVEKFLFAAMAFSSALRISRSRSLSTFRGVALGVFHRLLAT